MMIFSLFNPENTTKLPNQLLWIEMCYFHLHDESSGVQYSYEKMQSESQWEKKERNEK